MSRALEDAYFAFRSDPENDDKTDGMFCARSPEYKIMDVKELAKSAAFQQRLLLARREQYAGLLSSVDAALFKRAKEGDSKAASLVYARFENWTPRTADAAAKRDPDKKTFAQLMGDDDES